MPQNLGSENVGTRLDGGDRRRKPAATKRATSAIDLSEEHHHIVRISSSTAEHFNQSCQQTLLSSGVSPGRHKHFDHQHLLRSRLRQTRIVEVDSQIALIKTKKPLKHVVVGIS